MFNDKPSIKYLYLFSAKSYMHMSKTKLIGTFKLSYRVMKYYDIG
jgi:hypothetical protein